MKKILPKRKKERNFIDLPTFLFTKQVFHVENFSLARIFAFAYTQNIHRFSLVFYNEIFYHNKQF